MYTSGSTGNPKGVILTHANIIAALGGLELLIEGHLNVNDLYLAYLPLAHVLEFVVEGACLFLGVPLGYGSPKTLTDASVRNCRGDICELRPTLLAGVPAVWESIRKGIMGKVAGLSSITQFVFNAALSIKHICVKLGLPTFLLDRLFFKKIKDQIGGRLRFALSGGAPCPKETHTFLSLALCPVIQGYGLTETCGASFLQDVNHNMELGSVGAPSPAIEMKLVSFENYKTSSTPPQGEIWVRGPAVTKGYYEQADITAETITDDGWFQTGDIGVVDSRGCLSIIDRKKNLIKLSNGEYIRLEHIESILKTSRLVQHVMVYANSEKSFGVALVVPIEKELQKLGSENSVKGISNYHHFEDLKDVSGIKELTKLVFDDLIAVSRKSDLKRAEYIGAVTLMNKDWTPQTGHLTAAMKLQRRIIIEENRDKIEGMYK